MDGATEHEPEEPAYASRPRRPESMEPELRDPPLSTWSDKFYQCSYRQPVFCGLQSDERQELQCFSPGQHQLRAAARDRQYQCRFISGYDGRRVDSSA